MGDMRKTGIKRTVVFTVKFTEQEAEDLRNVAAANDRRPGDQVRFMVKAALRAEIGSLPEFQGGRRD